MIARLLTPLAVALAGAPAAAQYLLAVESTNDDVVLLDAFDGALVDASYIDLSVAGGGTPIEAIVVEGEIWVSDQIADKLIRFSLDGTTYLGDVVGGMDNIRGLDFIGGVVFVSNSNAGGGAPGDAIVMFDAAGMALGNFAVPDPFDVLEFQGDFLITDIAGDDLRRYTTAGAFVSVFHDSDGVTGIDFPQQIRHAAGSHVLAGGFTSPSGVYEYDATGVQVGYWNVGANVRGAERLGDGNLVYTNANGIFLFDVGTLTSTPILAGVSAHFFTPFAGPPPENLVPFCFGDGLDPNVTTPCGALGTMGACLNNGATGNGCANSANAAGANLAASGTPNPDTIVLAGSGMPATVSCIYLQGDGLDDQPFGDGVRCAGGTLIRLRTKQNAGGASTFPDSADTVTVSQRGQVTPGSGALRHYQTYYRNAAAAFCPDQTFNVSNGVGIVW